MPKAPRYPVVTPVGEDGLLVEYEPEIDARINRKVRQLAYALERQSITGVTEVIPAYRSLMVYFDPSRAELDTVIGAVARGAKGLRSAKLPEPRLFRIPTLYNPTHGPDLERVAQTTRMSTREVIKLFSCEKYPIYCLGFLCGLAYMGGVPKRLQLPRLATPRTFLPAGSVGFANAQAVVLPIDQPSGFHYIGRTFVTMYDPHQTPPTPLKPGDIVQCASVSEDEARSWAGRSVEECLVE
jgi:KipI family sensor histidine kinase inhibitor